MGNRKLVIIASTFIGAVLIMGYWFPLIAIPPDTTLKVNVKIT